MYKKTIKSLSLTIMLAGAGLTASAGSYTVTQAKEEIILEETIGISPETTAEKNELNSIAGKPYTTTNDTILDEFGHQVVIQESQMTREMLSAEKNRQVKENDSWGGAVTIIAMCIVIAALAVLAILFFCFGKISEILLTRKKKAAKAAASHVEDESHHELAPGEVIAAISLALSEHFSEDHDIEDTFLTIRRMKKAYSPWNSKIYNLRTLPEHNRGPIDRSAFAKR